MGPDMLEKMYVYEDGAIEKLAAEIYADFVEFLPQDMTLEKLTQDVKEGLKDTGWFSLRTHPHQNVYISYNIAVVYGKRLCLTACYGTSGVLLKLPNVEVTVHISGAESLSVENAFDMAAIFTYAESLDPSGDESFDGLGMPVGFEYDGVYSF